MRDTMTYTTTAPRPTIAADCDNSTLRARLSGQEVGGGSIAAQLREAARDREERERDTVRHRR